MPKTEVLAIIPARGGSKGLPGKNLRTIGGVSLVGRAVLAALAAPSVTRVVVSTDSDEISKEVIKVGAEVVRRPESISGDEATSESALVHCLEELRDQEGYQPELTVFLQCTSPLLLSEDIEGTVRALGEANADCAFAVAKFQRVIWRFDASGEIKGVNHDARSRQRRQERKPEYVETGSVYVMKTASFLSAGYRFCGKLVTYEIPHNRSLEIEDETDLEIAEGFASVLGQFDKFEQNPKALIMDFDGVFTDNRVLVLEDGREAVWCSRGDGLGLERLRKMGVELLILSKEPNKVVMARANKLKIECLHGIDDKLPAMKEWLSSHSLRADEVIYVGNDLNDKECMEAAGIGIAPSDSVPEIIAIADMVLKFPGGGGALREICDMFQDQ
ncbi:MAG: acylneuraminate cytidylyltransferase [Nitrospinaceae bacterium]|jgi:YrbI family 3-deoxy-D-manno-octulosonate 8-phosphate phosphatase|nr:acylneuraminate cytidylyltransferase [Nitrospinaceae bacterium]MBT6394913.1 acylneuraminate cytidylyltransferase [Nitrospinaceae bacterium]